MSPQRIQQRSSVVRNQWSENERRLRAEISRIRCAQLLASCETTDEEDTAIWAGGAMTISDLTRIAG
jgi:hypothetical protein